jgi:hypothetical protein
MLAAATCVQTDWPGAILGVGSLGLVLAFLWLLSRR